MKKLSQFITLLSLILLPIYAQAVDYMPQTVPNPKTYGQDFYVSNPDRVLFNVTDTLLNQKLKELQLNTGVEMAVVAIDGYNENKYLIARDFAIDLFNYWGIGDKDKNTGLLLFLAQRSREIEIITGSGIEGIMTDAVCGKILDDAIPLLRVDNFDSAIQWITGDIYNYLMEPDNRMELLSGKRPANPQDAQDTANYFIIGFLLMIVFAFIAYKRLNGKPGQPKEEIQKLAQPAQTSLGCLAFIFPIPLLFFYLYYRYARKHVKMTPPKCEKCGHDMDMLPEEQMLAMMDKTQQVENEIQSRSFSAWRCPDCGEEQLLINKGDKGKVYGICPTCGAKAYKLTAQKVLIAPTYTHGGEREEAYLCACCGHEELKKVNLPIKQRSSYSSGSSSSSSYRGGGYGRSSSSGSWGGGHSSGGGAGRRF